MSDIVDTTTEVTAAPEASETLKAARATQQIVDQTANLLLLGVFPGNACIQIGNSFNFLKNFSEKLSNEIKQMEVSEGLVSPTVVAQANKDNGLNQTLEVK